MANMRSMPTEGPAPCGFEKGDRVQAHPATNAWMRGDRYGTVEAASSRKVQVRMDRSGKRLNFAPRDLQHV
jgi:hypothetical protein